LILSVAKYAAPDGKKIQDDAVQPNVVVASNDDQDDGQPGTPKASKVGAPQMPNEKKAQPDDQLNKALDVLKAKAA
jgi:carboxyl-terminal processing protease